MKDIGLTVLSCAMLWAMQVQAGCLRPASETIQAGESIPNYAVYEWDAVSEVWMQIATGNNPAFDSEAPTQGDIIVNPVSPPGGDYPPSPYPTIPNSLEIASRPNDPPCNGGAPPPPPPPPPPVTFPTYVVTGTRPPQFGSIFTVIWRVITGGGSDATAQRGATGTGARPLLAPPDQRITCGDLPEVRQAAALTIASMYGFSILSRRTAGQRITIKYITGTTESYINDGSRLTTSWQLVPNSCRNAG